MKFSFDAGEYRHSLAEELRTSRAEGDRERAQKKLEQERATLPYVVAKTIPREQSMSDLVHPKNSDTQKSESDARQEIAKETINFVDSNGNEHSLDVRTFDISRSIPENIQLAFDIYRLGDRNPAIYRALYEYGIGRLSPEEKLLWDKMWEFGTASLTNEERELFYKKKFNSISLIGDDASRFWNLSEEEVGLLYKTSLQGQEKLSNSEKMTLERIMLVTLTGGAIKGSLLKEYESFLNTITDGAFSDPHTFGHVVGGFSEHGGQKDEQVFDVRREGTSDNLWFDMGGASYAMWEGVKGASKLILLCDSRLERFKNEIRSVSFSGVGARSYEAEASYRENLRQIEIDYTESDEKVNEVDMQIEAISRVLKSYGSGVRIFFKRGESWIKIASWVIDAYHGRLYKITESEISPTESTTSAY